MTLITSGSGFGGQVIAAIHDAIASAGLRVVRPFDAEDSWCATIAPGAFEDGELYSLLSTAEDNAPAGSLFCWQDTAGVHQREYSDALILELITPLAFVRRLRDSIRGTCAHLRIECREIATVGEC